MADKNQKPSSDDEGNNSIAILSDNESPIIQTDDKDGLRVEQSAPQPWVVAKKSPSMTDMSSIQDMHSFKKKAAKWRHAFIVLGGVQILGVATFFLVMLSASQQANAGVSGTEFIGLMMMITFVPMVAFVAFINLFGLPIFIWKYKPRGKELVASLLSLLVSIIIASLGAYITYQFLVVLPKQINEDREKSKRETELRYQESVPALLNRNN